MNMDPTASAAIDEDEDSHLCLKCNLTIIGLDNYVLHRRSKCGAGSAFPSIFEPSPRINEDRPRTDDPCSPSKALDFFSSLNLRSNRLEDFLDFDLPMQKNSLDMPSSSTSKHNDMRFPDIELDSNFEPIVDLMKNRKNHFDGLDLEHDNLISDANIANDNKFGRSILDSDIFSIPNENFYVMDQHLNLPMDLSLRLSQRPPSQPVSEKPMMYKSQESHFFCRTCNRRLATRVSHEKHLRSELHFKRLAENSAYNMETMVSPTPSQHSRNRRRRQLPHKLLEYNTSVKKYRPRVTKICTLQNVRKGAGGRFLHCGVCSLRVMERLIGKHLVSHFHCIQAKKQPELARSLILTHIDRIVLHSPFQCALCHFYCNTPDNLLLHFASQSHHDMDSKRSGLYWCQQCKVETATSDQMVDHLKSLEHNQLALTLNHMVPIIVRKRSKMMCSHCETTFSLKIQLVRHIHRMHQLQPDIEPVFHCFHCKYVCLSQRSLQRHELRKHGAKSITGFFCTVCDLVFSSREEVIKHRRQLECRTKTEQAKGVDVSRKCNICNEQCPDLNTMKAHIFANHIGALHRCQKCLEEFAISQDLSRHVRDGKCPAMASDYEQTTQDKASRKPEAKCSLARFICDICDKTYARRRTLTSHFKKVHLQPNEKKNTKQELSCQCVYCDQIFNKKSLLVHHISTAHCAKSPHEILPCNESSKTPTSSRKRMNSSREKEAVLTSHKKSSVSTPHKKSAVPTPRKKSAIPTPRKKSAVSTPHKKSVSTPHKKSTVPTRRKKSAVPTRCKKPAVPTRRKKSAVPTQNETTEFMCDICDHKFRNHCNLVQHFRLNHPKHHTLIQKVRFKCDHCKFTAKEKHRLKRHIITVHLPESRSRDWECNICHHTFYDKYALHQHVKLHYPKEFHCTERHCVYSSRYACELRRHFRNVHPKEKLTLPCQNCNFVATNKFEMRRHVLTHTERRPYVCKQCSKRFSIKSHLQRHMRNHKDNRPFKCRYCEFSCKTLENLRKHILKTNKHPGKLIYHCKLCKIVPVFATNDGNEFRSHLHSAHEQNLKEMKIGTKNILPYALGICENFLEISRKEKSQLQGEISPPPEIVSQTNVNTTQNNPKLLKNTMNCRKRLQKMTASLPSTVQQNNDYKLRRNYEELYHFLRPKLNVPLEEIELNSTELNSETPIVSVDICFNGTDECLARPPDNGSQPGPLSVPLVETSPETQLLLLQDAGMSSCLVVCEVTNEPQNFMFSVLNDQYLYTTCSADSHLVTTSDLQHVSPAFQDDVNMKVVVGSVEDDFSLPVAYQSLPDI